MRTRNGTVQLSVRRARRVTPGLLALALVALAIVGLASAGPAFAAGGPVVTHVRAASGPTTGGNTVTITGRSFMSAGKSTVKKVLFGTRVAGHLHVVSAGKITVTAPSHAAGAVQVRVVGKSGAMSARTSASRYTYHLPLANITLVAPTSGPMAGGTAVTITGTHFTGATDVSFGLEPATSVTVVNDTTITCTSPAYTPLVPNTNTSVYVSVLTSAGWAPASMSAGYTFTVPSTSTVPKVTNVSDTTTNATNPDTGAATGVAGDSVTIKGSNFTGTTEVDFSDTPATNVVVVDDGTITATVPAGVGQVDVLVTNASGQSAGNAPADEFDYAAS